MANKIKVTKTSRKTGKPTFLSGLAEEAESIYVFALSTPKFVREVLDMIGKDVRKKLRKGYKIKIARIEYEKEK